MENIEAFAEARGLAPAEFVRFATLNAIADGGASIAGLAPLIQTTFRGTHILASRLRDEMLEAGEQEILDEMVAAARGLQAELIDSHSRAARSSSFLSSNPRDRSPPVHPAVCRLSFRTPFFQERQGTEECCIG